MHYGVLRAPSRPGADRHDDPPPRRDDRRVARRRPADPAVADRPVRRTHRTPEGVDRGDRAAARQDAAATRLLALPLAPVPADGDRGARQRISTPTANTHRPSPSASARRRCARAQFAAGGGLRPRPLTTTTGDGYCTPVEAQLVDLLGEFVPHCEKFAFLNSGTDATAAAIRAGPGAHRPPDGGQVRGRAARRARPRHAHHGLLVPRPPDPAPSPATRGRRHRAAVRPHQGAGLPSRATCWCCPTTRGAGRGADRAAQDELACVLTEAASSSFSFVEHTVPLLKTVSERCRTLRVPFVLDEVLTGFRYGPGGAAAYFGIEADLCTATARSSADSASCVSAVGGRAALSTTPDVPAAADIGPQDLRADHPRRQPPGAVRLYASLRRAARAARHVLPRRRRSPAVGAARRVPRRDGHSTAARRVRRLHRFVRLWSTTRTTTTGRSPGR